MMAGKVWETVNTRIYYLRSYVAKNVEDETLLVTRLVVWSFFRNPSKKIDTNLSESLIYLFI